MHGFSCISVSTFNLWISQTASLHLDPRWHDQTMSNLLKEKKKKKDKLKKKQQKKTVHGNCIYWGTRGMQNSLNLYIKKKQKKTMLHLLLPVTKKRKLIWCWLFSMWKNVLFFSRQCHHFFLYQEKEKLYLTVLFYLNKIQPNSWKCVSK